MITFKQFLTKLDEVIRRPFSKEIKNIEDYPDTVNDIHVHPDIVKHEDAFEKSRLMDYTGSGSSRLNEYLRDLHSGEVSHQDLIHKKAHELLKQFKPETTNRIELHGLYSGVPTHIGEAFMNSKEGSVHYNPGFHSFSSEPSVAHDFAKQHRDTSKDGYHIIHAHVDKNVAMTIAKHSNFPEENEFIVRAGNHAHYLGTEEIHHPKLGKLYIHHMHYIHKQEPIDNYGKNK
jgi:hypothetical protein